MMPRRPRDALLKRAGAHEDLTDNATGRRLKAAGWGLVCVLTNGLGLWQDPQGGPPVVQWMAAQRQAQRDGAAITRDES